MDLHSPLSNPWMPYVLLGAGVLVTLSTLFVQVRGLPAAVRAWRQAAARTSLLVLLAGAAGLGSTTAAVVAVSAGGPGALVWLWIATFVGAALLYGEATLQARAAEGHPNGFTPFLAEHTGALGRPLAVVFALATLVFAIVWGLLHGHEAAALAPETEGLTAVIAAAGALFVVSFGRVRASFLGVVVPLAVVVYVAFGLVLAFRDPLLVALALGDAFNQAFGLRPAGVGLAATLIGVSLHHGVLRAMLAGQLGLGMGSLVRLEPRATAGVLLVPWVTGGIVSTVTALVVLTANASPETVADGKILPLETVHSRGLRPSPAVGQTIVLPEDTRLETGKVYGMLLRSNPRGHRTAKLMEDQNAVVVPAWTVTTDTDTIVFRSRDPKFKDHPGWDVRIEATRELVGEPAYPVLKLVPKDPDIELKKILRRYELDPQPYVELSDFPFAGRVETAAAHDSELGTHLAMFEAPDKDRPFVPKLHEFFRFGFRGPYAVPAPGSPDAEARPPWAFIAHEGVTPPIGSTLGLRIVGNPRGDDLVRLTRVGGVEAPPWDLFMRVRYLVVRHEDPARDLWIPVQPELDRFRIRLRSQDPAWTDFRKVAKMTGYSGPFAYVGDQPFEAEVHGDLRLPAEHKGRRALVPLDVPSEPTGPQTWPARPHPAELLQAGMTGPSPRREGIAHVVAAFDRLPAFGRPLVLVLGLVLAIAGLVAWSHHAERAATFLVGAGAERTVSRGIAIAVILAAALGPLLAFEVLLGAVDLAMIAVALPNLLVLALRLPGVKQA